MTSRQLRPDNVMQKLPLTYLFVPANRPDRYAKALASGAGAVIVDLEDAVTPDDKATARASFACWFGALGTDRDRVLLRINDESTPWFDGDLAVVAATRINGVLLPKAETASHVQRLAAVVTPPGFVIPLIETARGLGNVDTVASAPRVQRLAFGNLDYAVDLDLSGDERGFLFPASRIAIASRSAGIASPVAGVTPEIDDPQKLLADLASARACGFGAKLCIHPKQVDAIHAAMLPSEEEIAWARRVIAAAEAGSGAVRVDGQMVDRPVVERARRILARAQ